MREVGVLEAKTHLSSLLKEVADGGEVVITSHGKRIAKLVSVTERPRATRDAIEAVKAFQRQLEDQYPPDPDFDWKAARDEGRR